MILIFLFFSFYVSETIQCTLCDKIYAYKCNLYRHSNKVHGILFSSREKPATSSTSTKTPKKGLSLFKHASTPLKIDDVTTKINHAFQKYFTDFILSPETDNLII